MSFLHSFFYIFFIHEFFILSYFFSWPVISVLRISASEFFLSGLMDLGLSPSRESDFRELADWSDSPQYCNNTDFKKILSTKEELLSLHCRISDYVPIIVAPSIKYNDSKMTSERNNSRRNSNKKNSDEKNSSEKNMSERIANIKIVGEKMGEINMTEKNVSERNISKKNMTEKHMLVKNIIGKILSEKNIVDKNVIEKIVIEKNSEKGTPPLKLSLKSLQSIKSTQLHQDFKLDTPMSEK